MNEQVHFIHSLLPKELPNSNLHLVEFMGDVRCSICTRMEYTIRCRSLIESEKKVRDLFQFSFSVPGPLRLQAICSELKKILQYMQQVKRLDYCPSTFFCISLYGYNNSFLYTDFWLNLSYTLQNLHWQIHIKTKSLIVSEKKQ